jgi:hypothetical protein
MKSGIGPVKLLSLILISVRFLSNPSFSVNGPVKAFEGR